jgi:hypothetical protein
VPRIKHAKKLRDLSPERRHLAILEEIRRPAQTDRGVAIIGAAYVDLVLRDAITARLRDDEKLMTLLFEDRGPLQAFSDGSTSGMRWKSTRPVCTATYTW